MSGIEGTGGKLHVIERRRRARHETSVCGAVGHQGIGVEVGDEVIDELVAFVQRISERSGAACGRRQGRH